MTIYDFKCNECNTEFTIPAENDDEIRDFICVECKADFGQLEIMNYDLEGNPFKHIFEKLHSLEKECAETKKRLERVRGQDKKAPKHAC